MEAHPWEIETHPGAAEALPGAMEAHLAPKRLNLELQRRPGAMEAHNGDSPYSCGGLPLIHGGFTILEFVGFLKHKKRYYI
jgi:hypothetical protein